MRYETIITFGRFEPLDTTHVDALRRMLDIAHRVVVLIGSAGLPRSPQHPWTFDERAATIEAAMGDEAMHVICRPLADHLYDEEAWRAEIERAVADVVHEQVAVSEDIPLPFPKVEALGGASEQVLRDLFFDGDAQAVARAVPPAVAAFLQMFRHDDAFPALMDEHETIRKYKQSWASAPYPPVFVTADTIATCSGHVLLIQRKSMPGRGLWAFPGGFLDGDEWLVDGARRELHEETGLELTAEEFRARLKATRLLDYPQRSQRGRTISHGFHVDLGDGPLPEVTGADDAMQAKWIPIAEARTMRDRMFEDHFSILEYFLGL